MARAPNQFYGGGYPVDPTYGIIAQNLGTALFGDPAAAQGQARIGALDAQAAQNTAQAGLYTEQARGAGQKTDALGRLPELFRQFGGSFAPPAAAPSMLEAPPPSIPQPGGGLDGASLGQILANALIGQGGEGADEAVAALSAMLGTDEQARRGMVARGVTPGENFALTPGRADAISTRDAQEALAQALGVANVGAGADRYKAEVAAGADVRVAGVKAGADRAVATIKDRGDTTRAASAPRSVDGAITYDGGKTWVRPPPGYKPPTVTRSQTTRDGFGAETGKITRTYQAAPAPGRGASPPASTVQKWGRDANGRPVKLN